MNTFFTEVRQTLVPRGEVKHGPLPALLVAMTLVTGLVDAFSYLVLGHVFVANMTGNVVFLAFALAGAPGFSIFASLVALGTFVLGSLGGGSLDRALASTGDDCSASPPRCKRSFCVPRQFWPLCPAIRCQQATAIVSSSC
jgi:Protein of unknown function (DUF1275)